MDNTTNDYIDTKTVEKTTDLLKHLAIATGILAAFKIISQPDILTGAGQLTDYVISLAPICLFVAYQSKTSKHKGQFIRWTDSSVEYKSKERNGTVAISDLQTIDIKLDTIDLHLKDGLTHVINLEDYKDYSDRQRIKFNFEQLQQRLTAASGVISPADK
jgi:hypothetical protein